MRQKPQVEGSRRIRFPSDPTFGQVQRIGEVERRYTLWGQPGKVAFTAWRRDLRQTLVWGRAEDQIGVAGVVNGISKVHEAFLNAGGLGILVGDGMLPHPGEEKIIEAYYSFPVLSWRATIDYQAIWNPAYNTDRGPVSIIGTRLHKQF